MQNSVQLDYAKCIFPPFYFLVELNRLKNLLAALQMSVQNDLMPVLPHYEFSNLTMQTILGSMTWHNNKHISPLVLRRT